MEIKRTMNIGDVEQTLTYTLTSMEMGNAYSEARDEMIEKLMSEVLESRDYENAEEIPARLIEDMKDNFRQELDRSARAVMEVVVDRYEDRLEEYKKKDKIFTVDVTLTMKKQYNIRAKDEEDAERIFTAWSERHSRLMTEELTDDAEYIGEWDTDGFYEDDTCDLEDADICEEDI